MVVHKNLRSGIMAMHHGRNLRSRLAEKSAQFQYSTLLEIDVQLKVIILFSSGTLYCAFCWSNSQVKWYLNYANIRVLTPTALSGFCPRAKAFAEVGFLVLSSNKIIFKLTAKYNHLDREKVTDTSLLRVLAHPSIGTRTPTTLWEKLQMFGRNGVKLSEDQCDPKA